MELRHLEYFVEVVRLGGFTAAAKALGTTQPTVSKALSLLEHECGVRLLDRLSGGVKVTEIGQVVLRRATAMLAERGYLEAEIAEHKGLVTGHLRLGLPVLGSSMLFAPLVAAYRQRYPGIEIDLHEQGSRQLEELVRSGQIEMGATLDPVPDDFEWQEVIDEPMLALLPLGHPLEGRSSVKFDELVRSPFIQFDQSFVLNTILSKACRVRNVQLNVAARGAHADFIIALVSTGLGVSLLPRLEVEARGKLSVATALIDEPDLRWRLGLMWRRALPLSPAAARWLALVQNSHKMPTIY